MSTLHLQRQAIVIPGQPGKLGTSQKRQQSKRATGISVSYGKGSAEEAIPPNSKLDPIDKNKLSLQVLKQYNELVDDAGLTCRSLPPVKLSLNLSKNKFMDVPRGETSSRILKPQLTIKTHTAGHHVFTEGMSKSSKVPLPAFALPKMRVPYSNLPESVTIYKERNKFAFGVKNHDVEKSPYRLTPRPTEVGNTCTQLHVTLPMDTPRVDDEGDTRKCQTDRPFGDRKEYQLKRNKILLDPILFVSGNESAKSSTASSNSLGPTREPVVPSNSVLGYESPQKHFRRKSSAYDGREGRLSVVSIGDTVTPNFFDRQKRQTRKLYPMYDHKSRREEYVKRAKFGGNYERSSSKLDDPGSTFIYKISSRNLEFARAESDEPVSPIKNNLRNKPLPLVNTSRGLGNFKRCVKDSNEYNTDVNYNEQKLRRYYNRRPFLRPKSSDSDSSTDMSFLPGNPPPSETSHIFSEDVPQNFAEFKKEMITLIEERERTVSLFSAQMARGPKEEDKPFEEEKHILNDMNLQTMRSDDNETDTDIQMDTVISKIVDERGYVKESALHEDTEMGDASDPNKCLKESQEADNNNIDTEACVDLKTEESVKAIVSKSTNNGQKQYLAVPTFSLEKLSHNPLGVNVRERTSLSRSIQNMTVNDTRPGKLELPTDVDRESTDPDKMSFVKEYKTAVPVTRLRLFSGSSTVSVDTPRISLTDECGEKFDIVDDDEPQGVNNTNIEKRLVANANISFISPLINDNKAKRQ